MKTFLVDTGGQPADSVQADQFYVDDSGCLVFQTDQPAVLVQAYGPGIWRTVKVKG